MLLRKRDEQPFEQAARHSGVQDCSILNQLQMQHTHSMLACELTQTPAPLHQATIYQITHCAISHCCKGKQLCNACGTCLGRSNFEY